MQEIDTPIAKANEFVPIYWAHFAPEIQAFQKMPMSSPDFSQALGARMALGRELTERGFDIDPAIHIWDGHPWYTNWARVTFNRTDFYLSGKPITGSINPADYPPIVKPTPPPPADPTVVGFNIAPGLWPKDRYTAGVSGDDEYADGASYSDARGAFIKRVVQGVVGKTHYWERQ